jgi:hypothetical protein
MDLIWLPGPSASVKNKIKKILKNNNAKANLNIYFEILRIN